MTDELWGMSATRLAEMIRSKEVSSREVVQAHLDRIDAVNEKLNAVTVKLAESALAAADEADKTDPSGPLHGVPVSVKENIDLVGSATTQGVPAMAEAMPPFDAPVIERVKRAGAIPHARTNLPEMGLRISTNNPLRGLTRNPWDPDRTAGGSSGGEGAALASGMSTIGLGNDIGGSLRNPAYCNGITSLKPTVGRIPGASSIPPNDWNLSARLMAVEGPMARSVADLKLMLSVLAGWHPRDPVSVTAPLDGPPFEKKVGIVTSLPIGLPDATVDAIKQAGELLADEGWQVEEVEPPEISRVNEIWGHVLSLDIQQMLPVLSQIMSESAQGLLHGLIEMYDPASMPSLVVFQERDRLQKAWSQFFLDCPVVIGPTWCSLPFRHDEDIDPGSGSQVTFNALGFITPGNLLGIPAVALPMGVADGLPTGIQIYAERWREDICLDVAAVIESRLDPITPIDPKF